LALLLRFVFIYPQFSGDVKNHLVWGESLLTSGPAGFFARHFTGFNDANYPPITIYLFGASRWLYHSVNNFIFWQNFHAKFLPSFLVPLFASQNMEAAFMKLPAILADLSIGYLIYKILGRKNQKQAGLWAALYLLNPAVIYISAVWGQIESLPIFFLVLSFFFLPKRYYLSHIAFVLAITSKQTALWLTPVFLIIWWKEAGLTKLLCGLLLQFVLFILIYLPFTTPVGAISSYLVTLSGSSNSLTDQAFNLWYFVYGWAAKPDSLLLFGLPVRIWSLLAVSTAYLLVCLRYWKNYRLDQAANYLFLLSFLAFFLQTRVHDRHLAPAIPFLLLTSLGPTKKLPLYLALSMFHMINLYLALRLPFV